MAHFSYSLILAIYIGLNIFDPNWPSCNPKQKCRMAFPFSGKQSHVTFFEIPGQNKKYLKHECHNLMFLEQRYIESCKMLCT